MIIFEWGNIFRVCRKKRIMRKEGEHWKEGRRERERVQCAVRCCVRKKTSGAAKRGGRRVGEIVRGEGKEGANVIERHSGRESETAKGERKL